MFFFHKNWIIRWTWNPCVSFDVILLLCSSQALSNSKLFCNLDFLRKRYHDCKDFPWKSDLSLLSLNFFVSFYFWILSSHTWEFSSKCVKPIFKWKDAFYTSRLRVYVLSFTSTRCPWFISSPLFRKYFSFNVINDCCNVID